MLLRMTYSHAKRFMKRTIRSFKSYFTGDYQRLPKTPPCNPFSCTGSRGGATPHRTLFSHTYTQSENTNNHHTEGAAAIKETSNLKLKQPSFIINHYEVDDSKKEDKRKKSYGSDEDESSKCLVSRKLKELRMMDQNNIDLVLDIEEVLHYYSRLTCPVYRDIIEKFFVEMYAGTFNISRIDNSMSSK